MIPAVKVQVRRNVGKTVVIGPVPDCLADRALQIVGVVIRHAAGRLGHRLHPQQLPALLLLESALVGRNLGCRPGVDCRHMLVGAGGRIAEQLARIHRVHRDLSRRQQIGGLAQVLGVVCHSLQVVDASAGKDVQRHPLGKPDQVLPSLDAGHISGDLVQRLQRHPVAHVLLFDRVLVFELLDQCRRAVALKIRVVRLQLIVHLGVEHPGAVVVDKRRRQSPVLLAVDRPQSESMGRR